MRYAIYNNAGKIIRVVGCHPTFIDSQIKAGEKFKQAPKDISDITHKVVDDEFVNKTFEEIESEKSPEIPEGEKSKLITKDMWQDVLDRLAGLEKTRGTEKQ